LGACLFGEKDDSATASGFVNIAHQLVGSLGLGVLVVFATTGTGSPYERSMLEALESGAIMLVLALLTAALLISPPSKIMNLSAEHDT